MTEHEDDRPLLAEREELRAAVEAARRVLAEREQEARRARHAPDTARAELVAYLEEEDDPNPETIARLTAAIAQAGPTVELRPVTAVDPGTGRARVVDFGAVDVAAEARVENARRAVARAEEALVAFERAEFAGLLAELAPSVAAAFDRRTAGLEQAAQADIELTRAVREVEALGDRTGRFDPESIPLDVLTQEGRLAVREAARSCRHRRDALLPLPRLADPEEPLVVEEDDDDLAAGEPLTEVRADA